MTGADAAHDSTTPTRSVEIERKFDVDADTPLPDWSALPGVAVVDDPEDRELDAAYLDTDDAALARAGYALRRRTGGPDAGWHIKGPRRPDGGRVELHWPLGEPGVVPDPVRAEVAEVTEGPFTPLARIRNTRAVYLMKDAAGGIVAEFVDDHVSTVDERAGIERAWREWELELGPAAEGIDHEAFFAAATDAVLAAGGRAAASDSKLARALGH